MNHIKTGYLPTWWVFDSRAPKQDPSLAGIYAPLGPQIYASTRKGSKPCNPAASPVHIPRPQEGLHMEPYEGKTVSEEITTLFIVSFLVCCQQNIRCTAIKLEFEAINFIQFSGWSDNPCLQISTFGFPLSRSIYGGITPTGLVKDQLSLSSITQRAYHTEATFENNLSFRPICVFLSRSPMIPMILLHHLQRHAELPVFASFTGCLKLHICRLVCGGSLNPYYQHVYKHYQNQNTS